LESIFGMVRHHLQPCLPFSYRPRVTSDAVEVRKDDVYLSGYQTTTIRDLTSLPVFDTDTHASKTTLSATLQQKLTLPHASARVLQQRPQPTSLQLQPLAPT